MLRRQFLCGVATAALTLGNQPGANAAFAVFQAAGVSAGERPGPSAALFAAPYYTSTTNWYVATTGNDSTGDGSIGNPWATLSKANSMGPTAGTCINVAPGTYSAGPSPSATITHGGSSASSGGYVVYRSTVLGGAIITDNGGSLNNACFQVAANYIIIDGFTLTASSQKTFGVGVTAVSFVTNVLSCHHIWVMNCTISGYGQCGIQLNNGEFFYSIHNRIFNCCRAASTGGAQGSGISYAVETTIPSYVLTADDQNNKVTGNTGTLFRQFIMWNDIYNNQIVDLSSTPTDGNGIILDTFNWQGTAGGIPYTFGSLVAFNACYNNGGGGVHIFESEYVTVCNNSVWNNYLDTNNTGTARGSIDTLQSYGNTIFNNICWAIGGAGILASNTAMGTDGNGSTVTTTLNGTITSGATTLVLTSASAFPAGGTGVAFSGDYSLPGGNMISIDSEVMRVTAGWGTTTLTVQRGYYGTAAASHTNGATITWVQDYWANNISNATGAGARDFVLNNGEQYSTTLNKVSTDPIWVDVGSTNTGSMTTKPNGNNFALQASSPAIGFGQTPSWLPAVAADVGCAFHTLSSSP